MSAMDTQTGRPLKGWHVAAMFVGGFSIIITVNMVLAVGAVRTFPGKETESSYVASQTFDVDRAAQDALGWDVDTTLWVDALHLAVTGPQGEPVRPEILKATLGRATTVADDTTPAFHWDGTAWVAPVSIGPGNWNLRITLRSDDGTIFRRRIALRAPG
ncbi:nitrogen fixation protein FixH [Salipiger sp. IMCC34102]|uniref:FixH family protein n=1 Tax=Salipiger sp. IMCC34102 TaxID=2510647 RepID=UPI00101D8298|nr:FixH family protein [Salipiger sp. IMCC34102]RYH02601.1 nitrogen fixation protein FixH [Salipiger sp. IMCC34102]